MLIFSDGECDEWRDGECDGWKELPAPDTDGATKAVMSYTLHH